MSIDWMTFVAATGAILYFLIAIIIMARRNLQERTIRYLTIYTIASFLWMFFLIVRGQISTSFLPASILTHTQFYGLFLLAFFFLHITRSFLRLKKTGLAWWMLGAIWLAAALALDNNLLTLPETLQLGRLNIQRQELTFAALIAGWGIFMSGAALLTLQAYNQNQQPLHRNRIKYWPPTWSFTAAGGILFFAGQETLGIGFSLLGMFIIAYVVLTHHLPDIRQIARRSIKYLIITLLSIFIYTTGFLATQYILFQTLPDYNTWLAGAIMALVLAIVFRPLLYLIQKLMNRLISGTSYNPARALREYSLSISNILELEHLAQVVVSIISKAMGIRQGALFLVHRENTNGKIKSNNTQFHLRGVKGVGQDKPVSGALLASSSPVANCLQREHRPLTQYDIDLLPRFQSLALSERSWFSSLGMDVYVPVYAKGEWIGLLALGPKISGDRYYADDLALLSTLADQTAVALENARLFEDLKVRNAENEELNRELAAANRELARLDEAKSDFINVASHELRTPLTQVRGYTDILNDMSQEGSLTANMAFQMTQGISKASLRLEEIINTMFDVSQIDTQTLALDTSTLPLSAIIRGIVNDWDSAIKERKQTLAVENIDDLPFIMADGKRLQQVFSHLLQNAIKYTPDGGQIQITGHLLDQGISSPQEQSIEIIVADTGIGIAPDDLERVFEKFYRVGDVMLHSTGKSKFKGAGPGLGLTIAQGIVKAHGGRIWVESPGFDEKNCPGSKFHVLLPVQPRHLEKEGQANLMASEIERIRK